MARTKAPQVLIISLGGTIAMTSANGAGVTPTLSTHELLAAVPGLASLDVAIHTLDFRRLPGASLSFQDLHELSSVIRERFSQGIDGAVVVQGTDTIEETAYQVDLYHDGPQPLVVTGAMRNPTLAGADGPANVLAAVQTAASTEARGLGCVVVLADEIHTARRVRKTHSTSGATFQSPNAGPLGYLVEGRPQLLNRLPYRTVLPQPNIDRQPRVAIWTIALDDDGILLDAISDHADGAVIAGFGVGHVPQHLTQDIGKIASTIPVVLASRTGAGPVLAHTYGFPGSESDLLDRGLISAGYLDPLKARILLRALIAASADPAMIKAAFSAAGSTGDPTTWPWTLIPNTAENQVEGQDA